MKRIMTFIIAVLFILSTATCLSAVDIKDDSPTQISQIQSMKQVISRYINELAACDASYLPCINASAVPMLALHNDEGNTVTSTLFGLYNSDVYLGYVIVRISDNVVIESSLGEIPYNINNDSVANIKYVYDYGNYGVYSGEMEKTIYSTSNITDEFRQLYFRNSTNNIMSSQSANGSARSNLSNVPVFRQGDADCVPCAMSHMLLYWNNNGYRGLTPTISTQNQFNSLLDTVSTYIDSHDPNDEIPGAFTSYASTRVPGYGIVGRGFRISAINTWNPEYSDVTAAISNGKPVMLGFASGSDYGDEYGHMTLCVGARTQVVENQYVAVVDGHSDSIVTKIWNSTYNDFICNVTVYITP